MTKSERVAINHLHLAGISYAATGRQTGCSKFAAFKVFKKLETTGSVEKKKDVGIQTNFVKEENELCVELLDS